MSEECGPENDTSPQDHAGSRANPGAHACCQAHDCVSPECLGSPRRKAPGPSGVAKAPAERSEGRVARTHRGSRGAWSACGGLGARLGQLPMAPASAGIGGRQELWKKKPELMAGRGNPTLRETGSRCCPPPEDAEGLGQGQRQAQGIWGTGQSGFGEGRPSTFQVRSDADPEPELAAASGPFPQSPDHTEAQRGAAAGPSPISPPAQRPALKRVLSQSWFSGLLRSGSLALRFL